MERQVKKMCTYLSWAVGSLPPPKRAAHALSVALLAVGWQGKGLGHKAFSFCQALVVECPWLLLIKLQGFHWLPCGLLAILVGPNS